MFGPGLLRRQQVFFRQDFFLVLGGFLLPVSASIAPDQRSSIFL
jgi:hypothetical protein